MAAKKKAQQSLKSDDSPGRVDLYRRHREMLLVNHAEFRRDFRTIAEDHGLRMRLPSDAVPVASYDHVIPVEAATSEHADRALVEDKWRVSLFDYVFPETGERVLDFKDEHFADGVRTLPLSPLVVSDEGGETLEMFISGSLRVLEKERSELMSLPLTHSEPRRRNPEHFFVALIDKRDSPKAIARGIVSRLLYPRARTEATRSVVDAPYSLDTIPPHGRNFYVEDAAVVFSVSRNEKDCGLIAALAYPELAREVGRSGNVRQKKRVPEGTNGDRWNAIVRGIRHRKSSLLKVLKTKRVPWFRNGEDRGGP